MRKYFALISILVLMALAISMCSDSPTGSDGDGSEESVTHELEVNVSPDGAGTVSPDSGTYDDGEEVSITATSEQGWQFDNWTGENITSSDNPVEITMTGDRQLTANFVESSTQESFEGVLTVTDGTQSRDLIFSVSDESGVRESLDDNDLEGPPIAPQGAFFTGFSHETMHLYKDVRPFSDEIIWELRLQRAEDATMKLEWSLQTSLNGQLRLVDDPEASNPAIAVNMLENSSYNLTDQNTQSLYLVYSAGEAGKEKKPKDDRDSVNDKPKDVKQTIEKKKTEISNSFY